MSLLFTPLHLPSPHGGLTLPNRMVSASMCQYQPRWGWQAAAALGGTVEANPAYWRCLPREAQAAFGKVSVAQR